MMYECHVTIQPLVEQHRLIVNDACLYYKFKLAKLLKQNGTESDLDTFMTGHGNTLDDIQKRMEGLVMILCAANIKVLRYKIEQIIIDSRDNDYLKLTGEQKRVTQIISQPNHWREAAVPFA